MTKGQKTKGKQLESAFEKYLWEILPALGHSVMQVRPQKAGTQNGFDIRTMFVDSDSNQYNLHFECKDYTSASISWTAIVPKLLELKASRYECDAFIVISPHNDVSNIEDNTIQIAERTFGFPIHIWSPQCKIADYLALRPELYEIIYGKQNEDFDRELTLKRLSVAITLMKQRRIALKFFTIPPADRIPQEDSTYRTKLDEKLDAVEPTDQERSEYHRMRCDYKVALEKLRDTNDSLREEVLRWQENLKFKALRLTERFNKNTNYSPTQFYDDFYDEAERELQIFISKSNYDIDIQKLLNGIIFELAAECPLDWRKNEPIQKTIH